MCLQWVYNQRQPLQQRHLSPTSHLLIACWCRLVTMTTNHQTLAVSQLSSCAQRSASPRSKSPVSARCCRTRRTSIDWLASSGRCRLANIFTRTRVSSRPRRWLRSIAASSRNSTDCWSRTPSRPTITQNFSRSGSRRTTLKRRNCEVVRWELSASTASGRSFRYRAPSGTARRRRTASRRDQGRCYVTGTRTTRTRHRERRESWQRRLVWRPRRSATGSRTDARETELTTAGTGQFCTHRLTYLHFHSALT